MKWKENARTAIGCVEILGMAGAMRGLSAPIVIRHGKHYVAWTHTRDICEEDENGDRSISATMTFNEGEYLFPFAYLHAGKGIVGYPKDAKMTERGWVIYLDAVLRDKSGHPVIVEDQEIDMSGWYLESTLTDADHGKEPLKLGAMTPSIEEMIDARNLRIRSRAELENRV